MITLARLCSRLPLSWLHLVGALLGWLAWLLSPTYRRNMRANMVHALGEADATRLRAAAIGEAGKGMLELPRIWLRPLTESAARVVKVSGWESVSYTHLDVYKRQLLAPFQRSSEEPKGPLQRAASLPCRSLPR